MRRGVLICLAVFAVAAGIFCAVPMIQRHNEELAEKAEFYAGVSQREKAWIMANQTPEGAFTTYQIKGGSQEEPEENGVNPYFANIAAQSLLDGTPGPEELESVKRYLNWFIRHINTLEEDPVNGPGTIYDYTVLLAEDGSETAISKGEYDSVDSYCGTFLWLAADYVRTSGDQKWARGAEGDLHLIMDALLRCMDEKGRAFGKKEYPIRYLMDNCEVNAGLKGARYLLEEAPSQGERYSRITEVLKKNTKQLQEDFWNQEEGRYETGFDAKGKALSFAGWERLYAEAAAQVFPVVWAVTDREDDKARQVYETLCNYWDWEEMDYVEAEESKFYWTIFGYAGALMGDEARTREFFRTYEEKTAQSRGYPLHIDDAGWMVKAAESMKGELEGRIIRLPF